MAKKGKKDGMLHIQRQFLTLDEFFSRLKFIVKSRLNASLDAEFNALKEYVILIEIIDLKNGEKNEKNR